MPDIEIPKHYRTTYKNNVQHLLNNEGSILRAAVMEQFIDGEKASVVDQFGVTRGKLKTDRHGDTPIMTTPRDRRWVFPAEFEWGDLIDDEDKLKTVLDPTSSLVTGAAWGLGENIDYDMIIPSFFADAKVGRNGETTEVFDTAGQVVGVQVGTSPLADTGMNVAKLQAAHKILRQRKVKMRREEINIAITAQQEDDLFNDAKAINADFISGRPIERGDLPTLFGMTFHLIEDLEVDAGLFRRCPVWAKSGISLGIGKDINVQVGPDPSKRFLPRIYASLIGGATRTEQGKVVEIKCKE